MADNKSPVLKMVAMKNLDRFGFINSSLEVSRGNDSKKSLRWFVRDSIGTMSGISAQLIQPSSSHLFYTCMKAVVKQRIVLETPKTTPQRHKNRFVF